MRKLELKGVYEAYTNSDLTEGRGGHVHIGYFTRERDARRAVKGQGVMGTDASVHPVDHTFTVFDSFEEFEKVRAEDARARGLAKLTYAEREALGIK